MGFNIFRHVGDDVLDQGYKQKVYIFEFVKTFKPLADRNLRLSFKVSK